MNTKQKKLVGVILAVAFITIIALAVYLSLGREKEAQKRTDNNKIAQTTKYAGVAFFVLAIAVAAINLIG